MTAQQPEPQQPSSTPSSTSTPLQTLYSSKEKIFTYISNMDRETSIRVATLLFLLYVYNNAGFIFLLITLYRVYFTFRMFPKMIQDAPSSSSAEPLPLSAIEKIALEVVTNFFGR